MTDPCPWNIFCVKFITLSWAKPLHLFSMAPWVNNLFSLVKRRVSSFTFHRSKLCRCRSNCSTAKESLFLSPWILCIWECTLQNNLNFIIIEFNKWLFTVKSEMKLNKYNYCMTHLYHHWAYTRGLTFITQTLAHLCLLLHYSQYPGVRTSLCAHQLMSE